MAQIINLFNFESFFHFDLGRRGEEGGNYLRAAIISNILTKMERLFEGGD